jgi:sugar-phosphatase
MKLHCKAFLFDLDGVLVDSRAVVEQTWRRWASRHRMDPERLLAIAHGRRTRDTLQVVAPALATDVEVAWLDAAELANVDGLRAVAGATQLLASLPAARWGVVTSCGRALAQLRLGAVGLPIPHVLVVSEEVKAGKPAPDGYRLGARRLGFDAAQCVVFEDAPAGVVAARAAGATVVGVTTTHSLQQLPDVDATIVDFTSIRVTRDDGGFAVAIP